MYKWPLDFYFNESHIVWITILFSLGKIDNEFDQRLMKSFLEKLFVPGSFDGDFSLAKAQPNKIIF